ncbi:MAG: endopeptidase La [Lachnospiraceae bacterium]|nr:endopeptidase La [Lachnospiraceae bacterium]
MSESRKLMPTVALRGLTILPDMIIHFDISRDKSMKAVEKAMLGDQKLFLVTQRDPVDDEPGFDQVYHVGTIALIKQVIKMPNNINRVLVEGLERAMLYSCMDDEKSGVLAEIEIPELDKNLTEASGSGFEARNQAMIRELKLLFNKYCQYYPKIGETLRKNLEGVQDLQKVIDRIAIDLPLSYGDRQKILETLGLEERYEELAVILANEAEVARVRNELAQNIKSRVDKNQRNYLLREQMAYIQEELEDGDDTSEEKQYEKSLEALEASDEVKAKIKKSITRLKTIGMNSSESTVERGYIETLLDLPWDHKTTENFNILKAEKVLNRDHYGLENVKERVLEFLAVRKLNEKGETPMICLVGPPGTGKTSIARSVASALSLEYVRICLGGVRDEAEIRGHRKTYIGAMPGRIINGLKQAGCKNPVMLLDEIDKISSDYKGDTSSALLEVLDPEQNCHFVDHYVELPVDLSEVLFIATANSTDTIPRPLLDRMEVIEISGYTANEKFHIAKEHLLAKEMAKNGLSTKMVNITDSAIKEIIQSYTRESGVRELQRKIGAVCRKAAWEILKDQTTSDEMAESNGQTGNSGQTENSGQTGNNVPASVTRRSVTKANLQDYLGMVKFLPEKKNHAAAVGIVRGLAWTSVGGVTLQIEVNQMPGTGEVELTGQLGDVMKESAMIAMSYARSVAKAWHVPADAFKKNDFHLHIPEGAVPKDGPSAGITMATALLSSLTKTPVRADLAMTGELTLRGRVLPIGGLKEKLLAAKTIGIRQVLVPLENEKDVEEISDEIKEGMEITFVSSMKEVLTQAFVEKKKEEKNGN